MTKLCKTHTDLFKSILRENKLKITPARLNILDILQHSESPLSIHAVKQKLRLDDSEVATLYRTFESLSELDIVTKVDLRHGHAHYELQGGEHHHHLTCKRCGKVKNIPYCDAPKIEQKAMKDKDFASIDSHSIEFFGVCKSCAGK